MLLIFIIQWVVVVVCLTCNFNLFPQCRLSNLIKWKCKCHKCQCIFLWNHLQESFTNHNYNNSKINNSNSSFQITVNLIKKKWRHKSNYNNNLCKWNFHYHHNGNNSNNNWEHNNNSFSQIFNLLLLLINQMIFYQFLVEYQDFLINCRHCKDKIIIRTINTKIKINILEISLKIMAICEY